MTADAKPAVVFNCMIILQSAISDHGPSHAVYRLFEGGELRLHVSAEVLTEVADVLTRPKVTRKFPVLTADRVMRPLRQLRRKGIMVADVPRVFTHARDPKDERYVNL